MPPRTSTRETTERTLNTGPLDGSLNTSLSDLSERFRLGRENFTGLGSSTLHRAALDREAATTVRRTRPAYPRHHDGRAHGWADAAGGPDPAVAAVPAPPLARLARRHPARGRAQRSAVRRVRGRQPRHRP